MAVEKRTRRTQEERTAGMRNALIEASVRVIERLGYGGASTALIADEAGVSRGAILHHFGTRAQLMADVVQWVYECELNEYAAIEEDKHIGDRLSDWPALLWEVLSKPSGVAVLEILQASRSDPELADRVLPMQQRVEESALQGTMSRFGTDRETTLAAMRLMVWAARGLSIERVLIPNPDELRKPIRLLQMLFERAAPDGTFAPDFVLKPD